MKKKNRQNTAIALLVFLAMKFNTKVEKNSIKALWNDQTNGLKQTLSDEKTYFKCTNAFIYKKCSLCHNCVVTLKLKNQAVENDCYMNMCFLFILDNYDCAISVSP